MSASHYLSCWNNRWFNTTMIRRRNFDGQIVSMQQSGTHWILRMLSACLAELCHKELPDQIHSLDFIGHPKQGPKYRDIPQIVHSHSLPHGLMYVQGVAKSLQYPQYILLVRDLRHALVSHYEKHKTKYVERCGVNTFSEYLTGESNGKPFFSDIWRQIEFLNSWGRLIETGFYNIQVLRYEDVKADTAGSLRLACAHLGLDVSEEIIQSAVVEGSKEKMAGLSEFRRHQRIVRQDTRHPFEWFSAEDRQVFQTICSAHLKYSFGYDYSDWSR